MCGIAGIVQPPGSVVSVTLLQAMLAGIRHRGPDGQGVWLDGNAGLAHARLSIIDLEGGAQPKGSADGQVQVCFNGEIYNFRELRRDLESVGHVFTTYSDTEVILHAWTEWGEGCVTRLRGMFAFAIVDLRRRGLFIARDPLGIKPLVWGTWAGQIVFASEINALRVLPGFPEKIDLAAIDDYLRLGFIPAPKSAWASIRKLLPGHFAWVSLDAPTRVEPQCYWSLKLGQDLLPKDTDWNALLVDTLRDSVRAHLVADVPYGAFLSGGVDSTAIVSLMSGILQTPVQTFAVGFDDPDFDELRWAQQASKHFGTDHHELCLGSEALEALPDLVRHYGEPFGDSSAIPTYWISRLARTQVPMVLSGDGGDEAFLGYRRYARWLDWLRPGAPQRALWKRMVRPVLRCLAPGRFPRDIQLRVPSHMEWASWIGGGDLSHAWHPEIRNALPEGLGRFAEIARLAHSSCTDEQFGQFLDYSSYLPDDLLVKVDIASMAHGLEVRTPLVDVRVAELAGRIPWEVNLAWSKNGNRRGKALLKNLVAQDLGEKFSDRSKTGFSVPLERWLNSPHGRRLRDDLLGGLENCRIGQWLQPESFADIGTSMRVLSAGDSNRAWRLLVLEEWLRQAES